MLIFWFYVDKTLPQIDGIKYWCLVNLSADEGAKAASSLQKHEIEYFNKLIESIIENDGVIEDAAREKIGWLIY